MKFWQSLLSDIIGVSLSYCFYKFGGFELSIILLLGLILSNVIKLNYKPKAKPPMQVYSSNKRRIRF